MWAISSVRVAFFRSERRQQVAGQGRSPTLGLVPTARGHLETLIAFHGPGQPIVDAVETVVFNLLFAAGTLCQFCLLPIISSMHRGKIHTLDVLITGEKYSKCKKDTQVIDSLKGVLAGVLL